MAQQRKAAPQSAEAKAERAAQRAAKQAEREAAEREKAATHAARRAAELENARMAVGTLEELRRQEKARQRQRNGLANHLAGFYEEVDKLAKGKAMLEVTPLVLDEANQIIRDAKAIVAGDAYLDRVKEFVPAGNNPVYPDVVVALRTVRQALDRADTHLHERVERIEARLNEAYTVELGLIFTVEADKPPTVWTVKHRMTGDATRLDLSWFTPDAQGHGGESRVFDLDRLDATGPLNDYFAVEDEE